MTNLERLLENDAEKLAELLVKPYYDEDGSFIGYIGPNQVVHLVYDPDRVRIHDRRIKQFIFEANSDPYYHRIRCKDDIIKWLKEPFDDKE